MTSEVTATLIDAGRVGLGGMLGVLARYGISIAFASSSLWPWPIFTVNVLGAFLLSLLVYSLRARTGHDERRRSINLVLGTGFMGGFTTYSAFALETLELTRVAPWLGLAYALTSLGLGLAATWAGYHLAQCIAGGPGARGGSEARA